MKKILFLMVTIFSATTAAQNCGEQFQAQYKLTKNGHEQKVNMWRKGNNVAYQNAAINVTDHWAASAKNRTKLVRLFESHKRGIEYEPKLYSGKLSWQNLYHRFDPSQLTNMTLVDSLGQGCEKVETYEFNNKDKQIEVKWRPSLKLATSILVTSGKSKMSWLLQQINFDTKLVNEQFASWDDYYLTDYVDIGDNESDPFLAKMINMGFVQSGASGFYDSQGNQLSGHGHKH